MSKSQIALKHATQLRKYISIECDRHFAAHLADTDNMTKFLKWRDCENRKAEVEKLIVYCTITSKEVSR